MNWFKKIFCRNKWPKKFHIEVRDGNCRLIGAINITVNNHYELMAQGAQFAQDAMAATNDDNIDEAYWHYEEV